MSHGQRSTDEKQHRFTFCSFALKDDSKPLFPDWLHLRAVIKYVKMNQLPQGSASSDNLISAVPGQQDLSDIDNVSRRVLGYILTHQCVCSCWADAFLFDITANKRWKPTRACQLPFLIHTLRWLQQEQHSTTLPF